MEERLKEMLASTIYLLSQKMKKDYMNEDFLEYLKEEIGIEDEEIDEMIEIIDSF